MHAYVTYTSLSHTQHSELASLGHDNAQFFIHTRDLDHTFFIQLKEVLIGLLAYKVNKLKTNSKAVTLL